MDLMDMVKGAVSKQLMGQLGGMLGTDEKKTSSVFETAAGSILGGLIKKAGSPEGAKDVFDMAQKQDTGILDKLGDLLGGGDATEQYQNQGAGVLEGVFGGQSESSGIFDMIAKLLGLDKGLIGSAMKMLAPIVMGVIGKHIKDKALDAVGLGSFLGEQKKSLGFMPSQLTDGLGLGNLLSNATGAAENVAGAASDAVGNVAGAAGDAGKAAMGAAGDAAEGGFNMLKLLLPLILLAALAFGAFKMFGGAADDGASLVANAIGDLKIPGVEIPEGTDFGSFGASGLKGLNDRLTGITEGLKGVNAENLPALTDKITGLTNVVDNMGLADLPESGKGIVGTMIGKFVDTVKAAVDGISDEGILGKLKPAVDALIDKLHSAIG